MTTPLAPPARPASSPGAPRRRPRISTTGLAQLSARHPWRVLGLWLIVLLLALGASRSLTTTNQVTFTNTPASVKGADLITARLGQNPPAETVIVRSPNTTVDEPAFQAAVTRTTAALRGLTGIVASATNYYESHAATLVSADRHVTLIPVTLVGTLDQASKHADRYVTTVQAQRQNGFQVLTVGDISSNQAFATIAQRDLVKGEAIGVPVALVVLIIVFGALVAPVLPIALGFVAIGVALGLTALVGHVLELSTFVENIITMLGLAVGIDYSLFIVARYREERGNGAAKLDAIALTGGTASKAVLFSGTTVILALLGMFLVPLTVFHSLGVGAILVVLAAVGAMLTLVPALLSLLGDRIDWPRRRGPQVPALATQRRYDVTDAHRGFRGTITRVVMARPWVSAGLAIAFLLALAASALDLNRGSAGIDTLPASDVKTSYQLLATDFALGRLAPMQIVVDGKQSDPQVQAAIATLSTQLSHDPAYTGQPPTVTWDRADDLALIEATLKSDANAPAAYTALARLRQQTLPAAFAGTRARVYVTGQTAFNADYFHEVDTVTPWVFAFVLGLSFLLLLLAFRSVVVPATAIVMNLLSVGASYGLLVLVFQKGYLHAVLGFQQTPKIEAWIPIFLFCILFGLSMDYHVFLLSRIREHFDHTGHNREAVASGLQTTAKIITGAALIMVVVFAGFAAGKLVPLQEMGFGLAVAVFLDATVVRTVLVPAVMTVLGDRNWYFPRWLGWLPDLRIEGEPAAWP